MIHGVSCRLLVYQRIFSCLLCIFPVIYSGAFVHQSSMFRVVDVQKVLVILLLEMNGYFRLCYGFLPVCHGVHRAVV